MKLTLYIKEEPVDSIINSESIRVQLNNDTNDPSATSTISTNTIELTIKGSKIVNNFIAQGIEGGVGIFEGLPARLEGSEGGQSINLIDGYLDLADGSSEFECDHIISKLISKGGNDWFENRKDSFTYAFLASLDAGAPGRITQADYIYIPYIVSTIPNNLELAIITVSTVMISIQFYIIIKDFVALIARVSGVFTTVPAIVEAIAYIALIIIMFILIINLVKDLVDLVIQPVKYLAGMRLRTLHEHGSR